MDPTNEEEPEAANIGGPPDASKPKKEPKDMKNKELVSYCNVLLCVAQKSCETQRSHCGIEKEKRCENDRVF